jgi:hypothetical protein
MKKKTVIVMTAEMRQILQRQRQRFRDKFGREPGGSDPVFFDSDFHVPTRLSEEKITAEITNAGKAAGLSDKEIAAFLRSLP